jgi:choice-of-anchor A domain-containing protein/LPXTG-motif cell wall-anchored protein
LVGAVCLCVAGLASILLASPAAALSAINPVRIDDDDPANSSFTVFVEGDVALGADESEGTIAAGGNLTFTTSYNVTANTSATFTTPTAPGDPAPIGLYVGGGVVWPTTDPVLKVLNGYTTKIADTATFVALNKNPNDYQIVEPGGNSDSTPRIEGTVGQPPASVGEPVGDLIDIPGAFSQYRDLTTEMAACPQTVVPRDANGNVLDEPIPAGSNVYLTLSAGQTNVLNLTTEELANLGQFTFTGQTPSPGTPLLVNVAGGSYIGTWPNQAGISGNNAPYILWNFPDATTVTVTGGDSVEGTLYAPNADLTWQTTNNIEGNVIAASLVHGSGALGGGLREIHDVQFNDTLECEPSPSPSPSSPTSAPSSPTPTPTPTSPSPTPTSGSPTPPEPTPSDSTATPGTPTPSESTPGPTTPITPGGDTSTTPGGNLPNTGGPSWWLGLAGLALTGAGITASVSSRRRRGSHS